MSVSGAISLLKPNDEHPAVPFPEDGRAHLDHGSSSVSNQGFLTGAGRELASDRPIDLDISRLASSDALSA